MNKILYFYDETSDKSVEMRDFIVENYNESHILRIAPKKPGTTSYYLKHSVKKTPTIIILNDVDRELRRLERFSTDELNSFI